MAGFRFVRSATWVPVMSQFRNNLLQSAAVAVALSVPGASALARDGQFEQWMPVVEAIPLPGSPISMEATVASGSGITIAIVDTGVELSHPEFDGRIAPGGACFSGATCPTAYALAGGDDHRHGTHVAGIAAGATVGVAPGALILPVKVLSATGSGSYADVASGITHAAANGARVINMSLGGSSGSTALLNAMRAAAPTAVIVSAAGNGGNTKTPSYPAIYSIESGVRGSAIIVGAVDGSTNLIASFSQTPGTACKREGFGRRAVTYCARDYFLVAPGVRINSALLNGTYGTLSGTSMATPYVSGVAALVLSASPFLTPAQVTDILFRSATDLGAAGVDNVYGRGLVNPGAALAAVGATSVPVAGISGNAFSGSGRVEKTALTGPLGIAVAGSSLLSRVVVLDEYRRDYRADISRGASSGGFGIASMFGGSADVAGASVSMDGVTVHAFAFTSDDGLGGETEIAGTAFFAESALFGGTLNAGYGLGMSRVSPLTAMRETLPVHTAAGQANPYAALADGGMFAAFSQDFGAFELVASVGTLKSNDAEEGLPDFDYKMRNVAERYESYGSYSSAVSALAVTGEAAPGFAVSLGLTFAHEEGGLLGGRESGALSITDEASTAAVTLSFSQDLGNGMSLGGAWSEATSDVRTVRGAVISSMEGVTSRAVTVNFTLDGVFADDDSAMLTIGTGIHLTGGEASITAATGIDANRDLSYGKEIIGLDNGTPLTAELGYETPVLGGAGSLGLSALAQESGDEFEAGGFVTLSLSF